MSSRWRVRPKFLLVLAVCCLLGATAWSIWLWRKSIKPLGDRPELKTSTAVLTAEETKHLLDGNFTILTKVETFPEAVRKSFLEVGGERMTIANPGEPYQETDVVTDDTLPWMRLIFAGVSEKKAFVFYEQGGFVHSYRLEIYTLTSRITAERLWGGYCNWEEAKTLEQLRTEYLAGRCDKYQ